MDNLEFDAEEDAKFQAWITENDPENDLYELERFEKYTEAIGAKGLYGDGSPFFENTYNRENNLDQTLQFGWAEVNGKSLVFLQVHGGCDVRGGYTGVRVFEAINDMFLNYADGYIKCKEGHSWRTDDNYNWYDNNYGVEIETPMFGTQTIRTANLEDYKVDDFSPEPTGKYNYVIAHCPVCLTINKEKNPLK